MDEREDSEINPTKYATTVERKSERELVVTRTFNGPAHIVFDAWTKPRTAQAVVGSEVVWSVLPFLRGRCPYGGGTYRFVFSHASSEQPMSFFGRYVEVIPHSRLVWTNDEGDEGGAVTTKLSTMQSPLGVQVGQASSTSSWTSFSSLWERAWDGHEVVDSWRRLAGYERASNFVWVEYD
jgi:uncharacterized protein YndB with AHSA1/START domain